MSGAREREGYRSVCLLSSLSVLVRFGFAWVYISVQVRAVNHDGGCCQGPPLPFKAMCVTVVYEQAYSRKAALRARTDRRSGVANIKLWVAASGICLAVDAAASTGQQQPRRRLLPVLCLTNFLYCNRGTRAPVGILARAGWGNVLCARCTKTLLATNFRRSPCCHRSSHSARCCSAFYITWLHNHAKYASTGSVGGALAA